MLRIVVPAGTVGGSVSITAKVAELAFGNIDGFASKETKIIATATKTAAEPYLKVHFPVI